MKETFIILALAAAALITPGQGAFAAPSNGALTNATVSNAPATNTNASYLSEFYERENRSGNRNENAAFNPVWTIIQTVIYIGVFAAAAYLIIRFVGKKGTAPLGADDSVVEVILTKSIGLGSYLTIVKVGPLYYLLAVNGQHISLVDKLTDRETIDYIELNKDKIKPRQTRFFDILSFFPQGKKGDRVDFLKKQKDKLKNL